MDHAQKVKEATLSRQCFLTCEHESSTHPRTCLHPFLEKLAFSVKSFAQQLLTGH